MKAAVTLLGLFLSITVCAGSQDQTPKNNDSTLRVILLGTRSGPVIDAQRVGIGTLVVAGPELLLFDCGRGVPTAISRAAIAPAAVTKVFLTHLHSDHVIALPELYLYPWASEGRSTPFQVWGPAGTKAMMANLEKAFTFDIHVRRDVDEKFSADGIKVVSTDIREGVVYRANGVTVTAFLVDHAPVTPAFGYRVDYQNRSVVMSGDTRPSENLVKYAKGADLLIHEAGPWKQDPRLAGRADEPFPNPNSRGTRGEARSIAAHHTDPSEAAKIFERVKPKLAVFSHYNAGAPILPLVKQSYSGPVELGEDGMTIDIGEAISIRRLAQK